VVHPLISKFFCASVVGVHTVDTVIAVADTVTEMRMVKHAYKKGIKAQQSIEF